MACPEIGQMHLEVCQSLQGTLNHWQHNLQAKWGDPRAYQAEEEERMRQDARLVYDLNRRNTVLLSDAYTQQAARQRGDHRKRMDELKRRGYRSASRPPQSGASQTHSRSSRPAEQPHPDERESDGHPES